MPNNLETVYREGRLIRHEWSDVRDGREFLCLLTAIAGDSDARPDTCPPDVCPPWLAYLLPWIDDASSNEAWPGFIKRLIPLAPKLGAMRLEQSHHLDYFCRRAAVSESRRHVNDAKTRAAIDGVLALLDRGLIGDPPADSEWAAAVRAANAAWEAANAEGMVAGMPAGQAARVGWAAQAAEAAARAARAAAANPAGTGAADAAWAAREAAALAGAAAAAAADPARALARAARVARTARARAAREAADRIIAATLSELERVLLRA